MAKRKYSTAWWDFAIHILSLGAIGFMLLILLGYVVGGPFRPILTYLGIAPRDAGGVMVDCNDPRYRFKDFCRSNRDRLEEREIPSARTAKGPVDLPFSLGRE
jgi:hypothetical protein